MTKNEVSKPANKILLKSKRSAAIAWAAKKQEISYGKLMLELTDQQKSRIYRDYQKFLEEKEQIALSWTRDKGTDK